MFFKVTSQKIKPGFQPVAITIEVKDEQMFNILTAFSARDLSIPDVLADSGLINKEDKLIISNLLTSIHDHLMESQ